MLGVSAGRMVTNHQQFGWESAGGKKQVVLQKEIKC